MLAAIWIIGSLTSKAYKAEVQRRREAFNRAKMDYDHLVSQIQQLGGLEGFIAKRAMLEKMKDEILGLPEEEKRDLAALHDTARERQKQKFLEGFLLMLPLFPALALRVKRRYGPLVLKQQRTLPDGALSKLGVLVII